MYRNYGDVNFFEYGRLVDDESEYEGEISVLACNPYSDCEYLYQFACLHVDVADAWMDSEAVARFAGRQSREEMDDVEFALAAIDYYDWENFGASSYAVFYNWRYMTKKEICKELNGYMIASDGLDMSWRDELAGCGAKMQTEPVM